MDTLAEYGQPLAYAVQRRAEPQRKNALILFGASSR